MVDTSDQLSEYGNMASINMEVHYLKEAQKYLVQKVRDFNGPPIARAVRDSVLIVQRDARKNSPVNTGMLRASILPEVAISGSEVTGVVGSNVKYAPFMEYGTRPHWVPIAALEVWARRHGMKAFLVARAIARKGLKPRKFLTNAFNDNRDRIVRIFDKAVNRIVSK